MRKLYFYYQFVITVPFIEQQIFSTDTTIDSSPTRNNGIIKAVHTFMYMYLNTILRTATLPRIYSYLLPFADVTACECIRYSRHSGARRHLISTYLVNESVSLDWDCWNIKNPYYIKFMNTHFHNVLTTVQ